MCGHLAVTFVVTSATAKYNIAAVSPISNNRHTALVFLWRMYRSASTTQKAWDACASLRYKPP